jgi:hypothetical protein
MARGPSAEGQSLDDFAPNGYFALPDIRRTLKIFIENGSFAPQRFVVYIY